MRVTRSRPPAAGCRWWRWTPPFRWPARTARSRCWRRSRAAGSWSPTTSCGTPATLLPSSARAARSITARSASCRPCIPGTSRMPPSARARTRRASATGTSWAGTCRGTQRRIPPACSSPGARSACSTWCATCGTVTASSRPTGRPAAASRRWTTATRSWTSPSTGARSRGRTRPPAGRSGAPTRGLTPARPPGHQYRRGRADGPLAQWSRLEAGRSDDLGTARR